MKKLTDKLKRRNLFSSQREMEYLSQKKSKNSAFPPEIKSRSKSKAINFLHKDNSQRISVRKNEAKIDIPTRFSFIDNPTDSLQTILKLVAAARHNQKIKGINLDYSRASDIDLSAEGVLAMVAGEIKKEQRGSGRRKKLIFSGTYPADNAARRLVIAVGIIDELGAHHEPLPRNQQNKINVFKMRSGDRLPMSAGAMSRKEYAAKKFADHINSCLRQHQKQLTDNAKSGLSTYIGETIDNVVEHSGENFWSIMGYYDHHGESNLCEIVIFNVGRTFAETFLELPNDSFGYKLVGDYIAKHSSASGSPTRADLATVVALQGDISSKNTSERTTRGNGTIDVVEFFEQMSRELSNEQSRMAIVSGSTYIQFDGKYKLNQGTSGQKTIAFNLRNSLDFPPDRKYIKDIGLALNGTLIGIKFRITEQHTETSVTP